MLMGKRCIKKSILCLFLAVTMLFTSSAAYAAEATEIDRGSNPVVQTAQENPDAVMTAEEKTDSGQERNEESAMFEKSDIQEVQTSESEKKNPGWEAHDDGTWSYYDEDGNPVTGWIKSGSNWYYIKPETNRTAKSETLKIKDALYFFKENCVMAANGWVKENDTWYLASESGALLTGWQKRGSVWYYLEPEEGKMLTGLQEIEGDTYLLADSGAMQTGWKTIDGYSYFFSSNGKMKKNAWEAWNGGWYYLLEDGKMAPAGWLTIGESKKYYLDEKCRMVSGWQKLVEKWYYFGAASDGAMKTGWQKIKQKWYYFSPEDGTMTYGWQKIDGLWYYLGPDPDDGVMRTGWIKLKDVWYYLKPDGAASVGWQTISDKLYYFDQNCKMQTGWITLENIKYLLGEDGAAKLGWLQIEDDWYYFDKTTGAMMTGWQKIGNGTYYFGDENDGVAKTGWQKIDGIWYYFSPSTCAMKTGWLKDQGKWYYLDPANKGAMAVGWLQISGKWYYFYSNGEMAANTIIDGKYYVDSNGVWIEDAVLENRFTPLDGGQKTIKNLLQNAMKPVGSTLYIWGGGHDTGENGDARRYGVNPQWAEFYRSQDSSYDYEDHMWEYGNGLDCSGFVCWAVYNTVNNKSNQSWKISTSSGVASLYASEYGWGTLLSNPSSFKPGDLVSMSGHTYIVIGQCSDNSLVLVHSTPQAVQISGTCTPSGAWSSEARELAQHYMDKYYPDWYFTSQGCGTSYMSDIKVNRWSVNGSGIMTDPDGYQSMSAKEVLADLFGEN